MRRHCHRCGTIMRLSKLKCPYCREAAMSWLHIAVIAAFAITTVFYVLRVM